MRKILAVFFLSFLFFSVFTPAYAGLVPCGLSADDPDQPGDQTVPCTFCHLFVMVKNVLDFLLFKIVPVLAALMIAIGGFMYIFAFGKPETISQAKRLFTAVAIGLLIIYGAWVIINTFFMFIGVADWTGLKSGWWQIKCQ